MGLTGCGADGRDVSVSPEATDGRTPPSMAVSTTVAPADCGTESWLTFETAALRFRAPEGVVDQQAQGIDSLVGSYVGEGLRIDFDFGMYSGGVVGVGQVGTSTSITVDGLAAELMTAEPGQYEGYDTAHVTALHVPDVESDAGVGSPAALAMYVEHQGGTQAAIAECIVRSVEFAPTTLP
jgi:hypothetical protein